MIHSMTKNRIRAFDGTLTNPFDLQASDMKPIVMIHSISTLNRFHGHACFPYSVGQHTRNLVMLVPNSLKRAAMVHDFSEAFFNDLASPVKRVVCEYKEAEHEACIRIGNHFGVSQEEFLELDKWDKGIYANERDALFYGKLHEAAEGDNTIPLDTSKLPMAFKETAWRDIRDGLIILWFALFPEYDLFTGVHNE